MSAFVDIKNLLKEAYEAFVDFTKKITDIDAEEKAIAKQAFADADKKKIDLIKTKISKL
jgi:hypothetical protein